MNEISRTDTEHGHGQEHEHDRIDSLERAMLDGRLGDPIEMQVGHTFTPGLYRRTILMRAGTLATSCIHNTEHQFVVVVGSASVYVPGVGVEQIHAPYFGITKPGTRRVLYMPEDCVWATFHPTTAEEDAESDEAKRLAMIERRILHRRELADGKTTRQLYLELLEEGRLALGIPDLAKGDTQ